MQHYLLTLLVIAPIAGFIGCLLTPRIQERMVFRIAMTVLAIEAVLFLVLGYQWLAAGAAPIVADTGSLPVGSEYSFALSFYFDYYAAIFLGMALITALLVCIFSRYYMHRDLGFKRFYTTIFLFFTGLSLIILANNFELLFVGWEIIGISSVLLIAFYRDRFLPARNALKVFSVYRIADAALLAAIWYAHHIFEQSAHFSELSELAQHHSGDLVILSSLLLLAALIKSAQFPFSYWLPRAMEGPTTSSAIFYGALSVHMGLFLLFRAYPLYEDVVWFRVAIAAFGLVTAVVAASIARVQSSTKTQIAYASITQIGIMFIEIALGLHWLALLHFVSNASLRMYQLLISPSSVGYLIHDQFFNFKAPVQKITNTFMGRLRASVYVLSIKEWNMNIVMSDYIWRPLKYIGRKVAFLDKPLSWVVSLAVFMGAAVLVSTATLPDNALQMIASAAVVLSLVLYVRAFTTKGAAVKAWNLMTLGHLYSALFLALAAGSWSYAALYGLGLIPAFVLGYVSLRYLTAQAESTNLRDYHGAMYRFGKLGHLFFVLTLVYIAFPISPLFLAQDVLLSFVPLQDALQVALFCAAYVLLGVSAMRLYTKVFFGPHHSSHHEKAYRSS